MNPKSVYKAMYDRAKDEEALRWHREEIPPLLEKAVATAKGDALDIGCGTGVQAVFMAQHGYSVTALDFIPKALEFAKKRAEAASVNINFREADITLWKADQQFDLILDSGCLHSLSKKDLRGYKSNLMEWLKPNGNYVLLHFGKRSGLSLNLAGPKLRSKKKIEQLFNPGFSLKEFSIQKRGKRFLFHYWFVRSISPGI